MKRGPKPRQITKELLEQIEHHAARGLSQKQICDALGFSETWWHAKKAEYSELGESYKKGSVLELFVQGGNPDFLQWIETETDGTEE